MKARVTLFTDDMDERLGDFELSNVSLLNVSPNAKGFFISMTGAANAQQIEKIDAKKREKEEE